MTPHFVGHPVATGLFAGSLAVWALLEMRQTLRRRAGATTMDRGSRLVLALSFVAAFLLATPTAPMVRGVALAQATTSANPCATSAPHTSAIRFDEVKGISRQGTLWALLFYAPPARAGVTEKIVLRQTGHGALDITGIGPEHQVIHPRWGPEYHSGSNWNRPGAEWGTGWSFPTSGCWHLQARRRHASGSVWLEVAPPARDPSRASLVGRVRTGFSGV